MLEFDKETHVYKLEGAVIPSVTQVLSEGGFVDAQWWTEYHRWRGSAVHLACWYYDQDDLDESTVPDELRGYLDAYKLFKNERPFQIETIEEARFHPVFRYAGTVDRTGLYDGKPCVLDLKTGPPVAAYKLQLAAYCHQMKNPWQQRINLQLSKDGKYKMHPYPLTELKRDFDVFLAGLTITNWKRGNL